MCHLHLMAKKNPEFTLSCDPNIRGYFYLSCISKTCQQFLSLPNSYISSKFGWFTGAGLPFDVRVYKNEKKEGKIYI